MSLEAIWIRFPAVAPLTARSASRFAIGWFPTRDGGHALCGPIAIRGAEPGTTLEVQINAIQPGSWGFTVAGGWDSEPKPTYLAVPSGSVYYFRAGNQEEAGKLCEVLRGRCRSDFFGEKGLGLGVCGTWSHQDQTSGNVPAAPSDPKTS